MEEWKAEEQEIREQEAEVYNGILAIMKTGCESRMANVKDLADSHIKPIMNKIFASNLPNAEKGDQFILHVKAWISRAVEADPRVKEIRRHYQMIFRLAVNELLDKPTKKPRKKKNSQVPEPEPEPEPQISVPCWQLDFICPNRQSCPTYEIFVRDRQRYSTKPPRKQVANKKSH